MSTGIFRRGGFRAQRHARGLSLIEVLISVLVLGLGLLGLAMLQATNLKLAQSSNQRTVATNLANDLLDDIRSNRLRAAAYVGAYDASGATANANCAKLDTVTPDDRKTMFTCRMREALGEDAEANVTFNPDTKRVGISITWGDSKRWNVDALATTFETESAL